MIRKIFILLFLLSSILTPAQELAPFTNISVDTPFINTYIRETDRIANLDPQDALSRYETAVRMSKSINFFPAAVYCLLKLGEYHFNVKRDYRKSFNFLSEAISYEQKLTESDQWLLPSAYNLMANAYFRTGRNDSAIFYYAKAFELIDRFPNSVSIRMLVDLNSNMGSVLAASWQYRQGIYYINESIILLNNMTLNRQDSMRLALNFGNLGALYANNLNNMDSALYWWNQSISIYRALSMNQRLQDIYANVARGWMLFPHENMHLAKQYLDTAILVNSFGVHTNIAVQLGLATLNYLNKEYIQAIKYAENALTLCNVQGLKERKGIAYSVLSYSFAHLNDSKKSRKYQILYEELSDSLFNEEIARTISSMEARYRVAEKDKILAEKDKVLAEKQATLYQQRYFLTASIGLSLALVFLLGGIIRSYRHKRRLHQEQVQNLKQQNTIEQLQIKMDAEEQERKRIARELHDGLGTLISATKISQKLLVKMVPEAGDTKPYLESRELLNQMLEEVGTITNNLIPNYITQHGLESALQTLVTRFHRPEIFEIQVHGYGPVKELHPDRTFTLYRVIEEIMHNAVKHSSGNLLVIQMMYHEDQLHISIEDNGTGFDIENHHVGMGLQNIRSRIQNLNGHLHLSAKKGKGTSYLLEIPYWDSKNKL